MNHAPDGPRSRHEIENLEVEARGPVCRWILGSSPRLVALGQYAVMAQSSSDAWRIPRLNVSRDWHEAT